MTRGRHIIRRNGVYAVRFRIPVDLSARIGVAEFQRSLKTRDPREARRRGQLVITWFWDELERLRHMEAPSKRTCPRRAPFPLQLIAQTRDSARGRGSSRTTWS